MILTQGDKVMVVHRRLFENDQSRIFVGEVDGYHETLAKITGKSWMRDKFHGDYSMKNEMRTKIISLSSSGLIIYQLPNSVDLEKVVIEHLGHGKNILKANDGFSLDLSDTSEQLKG